MLSSFVGAWLALGLFVLAAILLILGLMGNLAISSSKNVEQVKSRTILAINLDGYIEERELPREPDLYSVIRGNLNAPQTLDVIVQSIREAVNNKDIVAIYLNCGAVAASPATLDVIHSELLDFKKNTGGRKRYLLMPTLSPRGLILWLLLPIVFI